MNKRVDLAALIKAKRIASRKVIEIAPPKASRKAERDYKRALRALIIEAARYTKTVIAPSVGVPAASVGALDGLKTVIVRIVPDVAAVVAKLLAREEVRHRKDWVREVKRSTGIDLAGQLARDDIEDEFAAIVRKNIALIQNLGDDIKARVERTVLDAVISGTRPADLAAKLRDEFGILDRRAQTIARDQTAKATSSLNELRQEQAGITQYRWSGVLDNRERESHRRQEGKIFAWAVPPEGTGHPGHDVNCLPAGSAVSVQSDVKRLFRRRGDHETAAIVTASGKTLYATPNHPVLTGAGWKPAQSVNVGDDLVEVRFGSTGFLELDEEQRKPRFGDLFDLWAAAFPEKNARLHDGDFHGDAVVDQNVEIVSAKGRLLNSAEASLTKRKAKRVLEAALVGFARFAGRGDLEPILIGSRLASDCIMRLGGELSSFLWAQLLHPNPIGLAAASDCAAAALQVIGHCSARDAELLGEGQDALAGIVCAEKRVLVDLLGIVRLASLALGNEAELSAESLGQGVAADVQRLGNRGDARPVFAIGKSTVEQVGRDVAGHVFNLETGNSWFLAENYIVHNCRCIGIAHIDLGKRE